MLTVHVHEKLEDKVQLRPPCGFRLPESLISHSLPKRLITSTYYDTNNFDLTRLQITLQRRVEHGEGVWQLTLPKGSARQELEISHGTTKLPVEFADLLFAFFRGEDPLPIAKLRTDRYPHHVIEHGRLLAEVTWDHVAVLQDRRVCKRWHELTITRREGTPKHLKQITKQLKVAGAENKSSPQTLCQALDLAFPEIPIQTDASAPVGEQVQLMLQQQVDEIRRHDPGTRFGRTPESLHHMRVATRRFRAILRTTRPLLDSIWDSELQREVGWLANILGRIRDFDVLLQQLRRETPSLPEPEQKFFAPVLRKLESQRSIARSSMLEEL